MKKTLNQFGLALGVLLVSTAALAKLPALSDEAKAKAAEAAAKTAWSGKVEGFLLCKSQEATVAHYKGAKAVDKETKAVAKSAKNAKAAAVASTCVDPGPFVYAPAPVIAAAVPATAVLAAAVPAPAAAASAKKP